MTDYAELVRDALRFFVWAAGEGLSPQDDTPEPETTLFEYSVATDNEDWDSLPDRIADNIEALLRERNELRDLVDVLRVDLLRFCEHDYQICEGCGAPIGAEEEQSTVTDVRGCWPYVSDDQRSPCYRYRTQEGADRSWPDYKPTLAAAIRALKREKADDEK